MFEVVIRHRAARNQITTFFVRADAPVPVRTRQTNDRRFIRWSLKFDGYDRRRRAMGRLAGFAGRLRVDEGCNEARFSGGVVQCYVSPRSLAV